MNTGLPIDAERYLANLAEGLRAMPPNEREPLAIELRAHFTALYERGEDAVLRGIAGLGSAQALADRFLAARSAGPAPFAPVGSMPASAARPFGTRAAMRETLATIGRADERLRLVGAVLLATLATTDVMAFLAATDPAAALPKPVTLSLRVAGLIVALVAAYRILLPGSRQPWRLDLPFVRYLGAGLLLLAAVIGVQLALKTAMFSLVPTLGYRPEQAYLPHVAIAGVATLGFVFAVLRFQPWMVGLATGRADLGLLGSWRGMRGKTAAIAGAWLAMVLPFVVLHYAISAYALTIADLPVHLALAAIDGIVATIETLLVSALFVTAYRWVVDVAMPEPAPFASAEPSHAAVVADRALLLAAIEARHERRLRAVGVAH